jgi:5'-AMP-activated protein kinase catalytic alpha subunit
VFLATKESQEFAIKIIDKDKIVEENLLDNIKKEIQHMKVIQHPYIVKLYEVMATHSKIILVLEYVEGGELGDFISKL